MANTDKKRQAKLKARKEALRQRKAKYGYTHDPKRFSQSRSITGHLVLDLLKETNEVKISKNNMDFLINDFQETVDNLIQAKGDFETHCRFTENIYLSKLLIDEIISGKFEPVDSDDVTKLEFSILKDNIVKSWKMMDKIVYNLYQRKLQGVKHLYLVNSLDFNEIELTKEYVSLLPSLYSLIDVGTFSKACRLTISLLNNHQSGNHHHLKYYRIREGYLVTKEEKEEIMSKIENYQQNARKKVENQSISIV